MSEVGTVYEGTRIETVALSVFDRSEAYEVEGRKGLRVVYKTVSVNVCGACVDVCDDVCKSQDQALETCACPHCEETLCEEIGCEECAGYIGDDEHQANRHALEPGEGGEFYCPRCCGRARVPPEVEMDRAGAPRLL